MAEARTLPNRCQHSAYGHREAGNNPLSLDLIDEGFSEEMKNAYWALKTRSENASDLIIPKPLTFFQKMRSRICGDSAEAQCSGAS